ncbi:MAG: hypothetical protein JWM99_4916 [Verrucomicrobiales bacterium]|jgi:hypothetical protein|nr:hypothetical protein [Verrucomicrobiales bacterium]
MKRSLRSIVARVGVAAIQFRGLYITRLPAVVID